MNAIALEQRRMPRSPAQTRRELGILAAVRQELTEKGYDGVTMEALAQRAGVVKKTLYNLYGSKDGLLIAAISEVIQGYRGSPDRDRGIPSLIASRTAAARQIIATPEYADAMARALSQSEPGHPLVQILLADAVAECSRHLAAARARGELVPGVDVDELAEQLISQVWGLILLWQKGLVELADFESRSIRGLLTTLSGVTRGSRRRMLNDLLNCSKLTPERDAIP
jgi:AcrR family transcriptional regulator